MMMYDNDSSNMFLKTANDLTRYERVIKYLIRDVKRGTARRLLLRK